jgi:hypothetical protein
VRDFAESVAMDDYVIRSDELSAGRLVELVDDLNNTPEEMKVAVATYRQRLIAASKVIEAAVKG